MTANGRARHTPSLPPYRVEYVPRRELAGADAFWVTIRGERTYLVASDLGANERQRALEQAFALDGRPSAASSLRSGQVPARGFQSAFAAPAEARSIASRSGRGR